MQVELRHRESQQGDLTFNFDPEFFNPDFIRSFDHDTARAGLRYSPTPNSDLLLSYIWSNLSEQQSDFPGFVGFATDKGSQVESQYIYRGEWLNLIAGYGDTAVNRRIGATGIEPSSEELTHLHPYAYANINLPKPITWTFGVSYDEFQHDPIEVNKTSPKLGVRWDVNSNLSIRAAAFHWVKPPLIANRTLEPTQVSGFNQVFDDANGDESWNRGVGVDWRLTKRLFAGGDVFWRDLNVPLIVFADDEPSAAFENWNEQQQRVLSFLGTEPPNLAGRTSHL